MKKRVFIISSIVFFLLVAYMGYQKAKKMLAIWQKIGIDVVGVNKINLSENQIYFEIDINLTNPTADAFEVSGIGIAKLESIDIYYKNQFIGTSTVNITSISIPGNNEMTIHDIPVIINKPLNLFVNNLVFMYDLITNFDPSKLTSTGLLDVAGEKIIIG